MSQAGRLDDPVFRAVLGEHIGHQGQQSACPAIARLRVHNQAERTWHAKPPQLTERKGYRCCGVLSSGMAGDHGVAGGEVRFLQVQTTTDSRAEAMELAAEAVAARLA